MDRRKEKKLGDQNYKYVTFLYPKKMSFTLTVAN